MSSRRKLSASIVALVYKESSAIRWRAKGDDGASSCCQARAGAVPSSPSTPSIAVLLRRRLTALVISLPIVGAQAVEAQALQTTSTSDSLEVRRPLPFQPGEKLEYRISFGPLHVGHGSMELSAGDAVRGVPTYHATFHIAGGTLFFHVDDAIESWFDTTSLTSLRFTQRLHEGRYRAQRDFEIYPAERRYERVGDTTYATVAAPLDDASFLYFVRTLSLRVGAEYRFDRYFLLQGNPIILRVLRTERITVPAGTFDAIVIQPLITTRGIFSQKGRAEVWLRVDGAHEVLQMNSHLVFGSLTLVLVRGTIG